MKSERRAKQLRESLAEDLGGEPEDYRPPTVADVGDAGDAGDAGDE